MFLIENLIIKLLWSWGLQCLRVLAYHAQGPDFNFQHTQIFKNMYRNVKYLQYPKQQWKIIDKIAGIRHCFHVLQIFSNQTMRRWYKESNINKWNTIEMTETDLQAKSQLTSDKSTMKVHLEKYSLLNKWCWRN
jgi:hypothetical protein